MKTGNRSLRNFFVKEPKFSILIVLIAIILLITIFLTTDFSAVSSFSFSEVKLQQLSFSLKTQCSLF
ncbi:hypothetical protein OKW21_000747 [Catalinimonas alkaloidigena]|nr:hypothetical protein [Catalinimonas alkaloidigena]